MEIKVGDKVRVGNAGAIYSKYVEMADMMGLTGYRADKYPKNFVFDVVAIAKHPEVEGDCVYALKNEDGEFLFNDRLGGMKVVSQKQTRTEYVKVADSIFDLEAEFDAGELYFPHSSGWDVIKDEEMFLTRLFENRVYRKVEREITWQDEVELFIESCSESSGEKYNVSIIDSDCGMNLSDAEFIEMCHKVYHLTK